MQSNKQIKRRMASVATTRKILRALNMVAASKLQSGKNRLENARSFFAQSERIIKSRKYGEKLVDYAYTKEFDTNCAAYLTVTSNRGMCGSYNANLLECVRQHMQASGKNKRIATVGSKGYEHFARNGIEVEYRFDELLETAFYEDAVRISHYLRSVFMSGEVDEIYIAYTEFQSAFLHVPTIKKIMPIDVDRSFDSDGIPMEYDPDIQLFLDHAIPAYLNTFVYLSILESIACENATRMINMEAAVSSASEIISDLTIKQNRKRQAAITQEISEIISGWQ